MERQTFYSVGFPVELLSQCPADLEPIVLEVDEVLNWPAHALVFVHSRVIGQLYRVLSEVYLEGGWLPFYAAAVIPTGSIAWYNGRLWNSIYFGMTTEGDWIPMRTRPDIMVRARLDHLVKATGDYSGIDRSEDRRSGSIWGWFARRFTTKQVG